MWKTSASNSHGFAHVLSMEAWQAFLDTINTAHDGRTMGVRNEVVNPQLTLYSPTASPSRLGKAARL